MNETQIVNNALLQLNQKTGLTGCWMPANAGIDGEMDLLLDNKNLHVYIEVKQELRHHQLPQLMEMAKKYPPFMVVADRISPTLKEILRENKIGYLDGAGNIYLHTPKRFVWLDGHKHTTAEKPVTNRAFTKTGLKTVFYLLLYPDRINWPYRNLAKATQVALGNINNIIQGLKEAGFILPVNEKEVRLQNKKVLLDRWIAGYRETLKPALRLGSFRFWNDHTFTDWKALPVKPGETIWGGEPAADLLTNYLNPAILTIYTEEKRAALVPKWKLIPAEDGNIRVFEKFWKDNEMDGEIFAPPLLVYADLVITDDPRCIETAELIYNKYLKDELE
ncbi:MAG: type IV toxin-antitoxin system AbiEi family antitoxin [Mucilaginibacter sp.]